MSMMKAMNLLGSSNWNHVLLKFYRISHEKDLVYKQIGEL